MLNVTMSILLVSFEAQFVAHFTYPLGNLTAVDQVYEICRQSVILEVANFVVSFTFSSHAMER